jgi:hypothetical protein
VVEAAVSDKSRSEALLDAAHSADQALWEPGSGMTLAARNDIIRAALSGGWTEEEIADHIRVASVDVRRWAGLTT